MCKVSTATPLCGVRSVRSTRCHTPGGSSSITLTNSDRIISTAPVDEGGSPPPILVLEDDRGMDVPGAAACARPINGEGNANT